MESDQLTEPVLEEEKPSEYWAAAPGSDIVDNILDKVDKYYDFLLLSGRLDLYKRSWSYYYRPLLTGSRLNATGSQGELTSMSVNNYRNFLVHLETMTAQQRPAFEPKATNNDVKSQAQVILAQGLLDYYLREKRLERNIQQAIKDGLLFGEGFVRAMWNPKGGQVYGKNQNGADIYAGDLKYKNYNPLNAVRDFTLESPEDHDWTILRDFENKYILAANFPDLADDILQDSVDLLEQVRSTTLSAIGLEDSDNIPVYTMIHRPSPVIPGGRYVMCLGNGTKMLDGPLPYKETHVYRLAPDEQTGSIFGYSVAFDLMPVQEASDIIYSTVITNQASFGVQNILMPKGSDLSTSQISGGLNLMAYDPKIGKPEALNLTSTPSEIFNFMQILDRVGETLSGVNSVARGNPEASLKSGAALALVQSMAIQFSMSLQQAYVQLVEDLGTGTIHILQDFAAVPRVAQIVGKSNRPLMKEFKGSDLDEINRVMVDMGNPLTRTTAGKVNLAESMLEKGLIENPDQYLQVVATGRLEPVIEGKQAELLLIKAENEGLADGQQQRAIITDKHDQHILEHKTVLASPEVRQDPNSPIMANTLAHIQEHINFLKTADPVLLQLIHEQSFAPPPVPPGTPSAAPMMDATNPVTQKAQSVNMPSAPTNPLTGQPAPLPQGPNG